MKHVPSHRESLQFKYNNYLKQNMKGFSLIKKSMTNVQFEMIKEYQKEIESSGECCRNHTHADTHCTG